MKITYREYKDADKQTLLKLVYNLAQYSKGIDPIKRVKMQSGYAEMSLEDMLNDVSKYQGKIWFAQDGEDVVGYVVGAIWEQSEKNRLEIGAHKLGEVIDLYIEEKYRRQGIGNEMLSMMERYFKEKGCDSMWITVFAPNFPAHNLYKKFGFINREIGMLKDLSSS